MLAGVRARRLGLAALLLVTLVWGTTFPVMKQISAQFGALEIILLRFAIASLVLLPLLRGLSWAELRWGLAIGSVLFCAFYLQVSGLAQTSSNRNAFVTGLNVLIVPLLAYFLGQRLAWPLLLGAALGVLGLGGLFYEQAPWSRGDSLTLLSAFVYAVYVLMFEFSARAKTALRPARIALVQSGVMVLLASLGFSTLEPASWGDLWSRSQNHGWVLLYLGVLASAVMVWLQAWGQHRVRAVEAAIVYGLEPVFAALTAVWWINETMSGRALLGGALIVSGVVISQIKAA
ncbi:MAG: DMT family transporter [Rhodoferax sp.]|uniref:DMT family transporter n=1 Tax=Rhodoferax sp. TaxID=50421 RepID=UPI0026371DB0|nr:DMT family transporter [Rhodoferax sp.]MDD5333213.1 DMT family transporter [Rhodoferax sp.]